MLSTSHATGWQHTIYNIHLKFQIRNNMKSKTEISNKPQNLNQFFQIDFPILPVCLHLWCFRHSKWHRVTKIFRINAWKYFTQSRNHVTFLVAEANSLDPIANIWPKQKHGFFSSNTQKKHLCLHMTIYLQIGMVHEKSHQQSQQSFFNYTLRIFSFPFLIPPLFVKATILWVYTNQAEAKAKHLPLMTLQMKFKVTENSPQNLLSSRIIAPKVIKSFPIFTEAK